MTHHTHSSPATPGNEATPAGPHTSAARAHYNLRARKESQSTPSRRSKRGLGTTTTNDVRFLTPTKQPNTKGHLTRTPLTMASTAGKWREEQILIICPGSRTTMAQLGCNELTLPAHRIPTRMFRDEDLWAPHYKEKRVRIVNGVEVEEWVEDVDEDQGAVWPIQGMLLLLLPVESDCPCD